jgi:NAD(P)-dependent dehydrogenase (short-subunit alcohol dehydrogenase family)
VSGFTGKVGFITGGGTGIGLACARTIVAGGGRVVIGGRREDVLKQAAAELGDGADWVSCDVTSDESVESAIATTLERHGPLQLAVNSAGRASAGNVLNSTSEEFAAVLDANLTGVFRSMRAQARAMKQAGGGSIVNISSIAGALTHRWMDSYCASKAGLNMLTRCAADDLGEHGIRVNARVANRTPRRRERARGLPALGRRELGHGPGDRRRRRAHDPQGARPGTHVQAVPLRGDLTADP